MTLYVNITIIIKIQDSRPSASAPPSSSPSTPHLASWYTRQMNDLLQQHHPWFLLQGESSLLITRTFTGSDKTWLSWASAGNEVKSWFALDTIWTLERALSNGFESILLWSDVSFYSIFAEESFDHWREAQLGRWWAREYLKPGAPPEIRFDC